MDHRRFSRATLLIAAAASMLLLVPLVASAQYGPPSAAELAALKAAAAKPTPHTSDGHPDLNGIWFSPLTGRITGPGATKVDGNSLVINQNNPGTQTPKPLQAEDPNRPPYKTELLAKIFDLDVHQVERDPAWGCKNPGIPRLGSPHQIIQTPGQVVFLYSDWSGGYFRVIPTDGRPHNRDLDETYMGDAVAKWDGDTLVVESTNFTDDSWIADNGMFHSTEMRVTERLRREGDVLHYQAVVEDPVVLTKPWPLPARNLLVQTEPIQEPPPCQERDREHLVNLDHHGNPR